MIQLDPLAIHLTPGERLEAVLTQVREAGHATVRDLARATRASEATIRRDLRALAAQGKLDLVYGGATVSRTGDHSLLARARRHMEAKRVIGELAGALVRDHEMLFVDSGTTCFEMRHALRKRVGLTLIVNSSRLAVELGGLESGNLIQLGGHYRPDRMDTVGPLAVNAIDQLRGYVAFIGADGLSMDFGISANEIQTAYLYQHLIRNARETILLADHSKFGWPSLFKIGEFDSVTKVVTNQDPGPEWRDYFERQQIELVLPLNPLET